MDIAKSMYLGGQEIRANSPQLSLFSYRKLGLLCVYCGEPVCYRKGGINQPHFSHFPSIDPKKYEECLLRQQSAQSGFSINYNWWDQQYGKGQRFQLFQKHFINILRTRIPELDISSLYLEPQKIKFDELQNQTHTFAKNNKNKFLRYAKIFDNQAIELEREITFEAFDYLTVASSRNLFKIISDYLIENPETFQITSKAKNKSSQLCCRILKLLTSISWSEVFTQITTSEPDKIQKKATRPHNFVQIVGNTNSLYVYICEGKIWSSEVDCCHIEDESLLAKIDISKVIKSEWVVRKIKKIVAIDSPEEPLEINVTSNLYNKYEKSIKKFVFSIVYADIQDEIEDVSKKAKKPFKTDKFLLDRTDREFWQTRKAKIFLERGARSKVCVAEVVINDSAIKYNNAYIFSDGLILYRKYYLAIQRNPAIEDSVARVIQEFHSLVAKKKSHRNA